MKHKLFTNKYLFLTNCKLYNYNLTYIESKINGNNIKTNKHKLFKTLICVHCVTNCYIKINKNNLY